MDKVLLSQAQSLYLSTFLLDKIAANRRQIHTRIDIHLSMILFENMTILVIFLAPDTKFWQLWPLRTE